jgi:hypothetical protein
MKYQVIGQNRDTGARMTLEFEAESKAAAERKATTQGMSVHRVVDITDGHPPTSYERPTPARRSGISLKLILILIILAAVIWYFWPAISKHL